MSKVLPRGVHLSQRVLAAQVAVEIRRDAPVLPHVGFEESRADRVDRRGVSPAATPHRRPEGGRVLQQQRVWLRLLAWEAASDELVYGIACQVEPSLQAGVLGDPFCIDAVRDALACPQQAVDGGGRAYLLTYLLTYSLTCLLT